MTFVLVVYPVIHPLNTQVLFYLELQKFCFGCFLEFFSHRLPVGHSDCH